MRRSDDANITASIGGIGVAFGKKNGKGKSGGVRVTLPSVGSTVSLSQTEYDLIDVNGDSLPDRVSMQPDGEFVSVQLNLGYRFGAPESWSLPKLKTSGHCNDAVLKT